MVSTYIFQHKKSEIFGEMSDFNTGLGNIKTEPGGSVVAQRKETLKNKHNDGDMPLRKGAPNSQI